MPTAGRLCVEPPRVRNAATHEPAGKHVLPAINSPCSTDLAPTSAWHVSITCVDSRRADLTQSKGAFAGRYMSPRICVAGVQAGCAPSFRGPAGQGRPVLERALRRKVCFSPAQLWRGATAAVTACPGLQHSSAGVCTAQHVGAQPQPLVQHSTAYCALQAPAQHCLSAHQSPRSGGLLQLSVKTCLSCMAPRAELCRQHRCP